MTTPRVVALGPDGEPVYEVSDFKEPEILPYGLTPDDIAALDEIDDEAGAVHEDG